MKIVSSIALTLALSGSWAVASADASADPAGIRVVGQAVDGTLVLDDSVSNLSSWVTPGLAMPAGEAADGAPTLLVIGHVESWDPKTGVLTVSGQTTTLAEGATIVDAPRNIEAPLTADNVIWYLQKGRYIAVAGDTYGGGESLATHIVRLDNEAKPGTAPIYVRGSLDLVDDIQGIAYIGNMALDLNSVAAGELPVTGNVVEVLAYQANAGNAIVSEYSSLESARGRGARSKVAGINGSGAKSLGINGSGVRTQGINGSGVKTQGITGSGARTQGINGSGARTQGINGSGVRTQGITGSGVRTQGITGSGARTQGITGSGARTQGITGSGARTQGITGSGARTQGITGSGARTQGITGSGVRTQGITGSGVRTQGITGSGARTQGITGSGARTQGITGSGARTQGITGSGARTQGITGSGART